MWEGVSANIWAAVIEGTVWYGGGIPVKSVPAKGVPDGSVLIKWAPAGEVRLLPHSVRSGRWRAEMSQAK